MGGDDAAASRRGFCGKVFGVPIDDAASPSPAFEHPASVLNVLRLQACWTLDADPRQMDPKSPESLDARQKLLREFLLDGFARFERRRDFKRRLVNLAWSAVIPVATALLPFIFPGVGQWALSIAKSLLHRLAGS